MKQDFVNIQVFKMMRQRNMSLIFGLGMLFANIVLGFVVMFKTERVILVPPEINKSFWITNKNVSPEYLEEMGGFLVSLFLNNTKHSVKYNRETLLKYVSPKFHNILVGRLQEQEKYMSSNDLTTRFSIHEIKTDEDTNKVILTGELKSFIARKEVKKELVSYEMTFEHRGFKYLLAAFNKLGEEDEDEN